MSVHSTKRLFGYVAADMALADANFASIVAAVREGRAVYDNIKKFDLFMQPTYGGEALLSGFFVWRVLMVSTLMMAGALGHFLWEVNTGNSLEAARTMVVNTVVVAEIFYLLNSRYIFASVLSRQGPFGNRYVLFAIAACIPLQLAFTHVPFMQAIFESRDLSMFERVKVVGAGALVFCVTELEKFIIRNTRLAERFMPPGEATRDS